MAQRICAIEDCGRGALSRGWCKKHYRRWLRHGDPLPVAPQPTPCRGPNCPNTVGPRSVSGLCHTHRAQLRRGADLTPIKPWSRGGHWPSVCSVEGCDRPHKTNGMCGAHYARWLKGSDLFAPFQRRGVFTGCSVEACTRPHLSGGYCKRHHAVLVGRFQKHGITRRQADELYESQGHGCAVCSRTFPLAELQIDHDHKCCPGGWSCGQCVRGLLCSCCNVAIGRFRDDTEAMARAIDYLTRTAPAV